MFWRNVVFASILAFILLSEVETLFFVKPWNFTFNVAVSVIFLFISGLILFDFTYKRYLQTMLGIFAYGFTSVVSIILAEAISLMYMSYLYPNAFNGRYSSITALGNALVLVTGYGYPDVSGKTRGVVVILMIYSWLVNVLLISKLISIFTRKLTQQ